LIVVVEVSLNKAGANPWCFGLVVLLALQPSLLFSQTLTATVPSLAGEVVRFGTFEGIQSRTLDSVRVEESGTFSFAFDTHKPAIGYLITNENKPYFFILDKNEVIRIEGEDLRYPESIKVLEGIQNQAFARYATQHPKREQALSAWKYLEKVYAGDSLFSIQRVPSRAIQKEIIRIRQEDQAFLNGLNHSWYVSWYLPIRRLISDVPTIAQFRTEEIPFVVSEFRRLDYSDERLYRSGLLKDALESHFWLLENSGHSLESAIAEMKISIDSMLPQLVLNERRLNEITDYLFNLLERHSLFKASEYLALKVLNESSCTINSDLAAQLETYRAMKKGSIAPNIDFKVDLKSSNSEIKTLSDLKSPYTLVVFGASWCEACSKEIPKIATLYPKWKSKGVEVVFVSLDETKEAFEQFTQALPFISYCDYGKWISPVVTNYYVFGTPTMFLLNEKREILLRPTSVGQMDAWVDWIVFPPKD
jgi:thiol-disulfide isomerase/thioredoxin